MKSDSIVFVSGSIINTPTPFEASNFSKRLLRNTKTELIVARTFQTGHDTQKAFVKFNFSSVPAFGNFKNVSVTLKMSFKCSYLIMLESFENWKLDTKHGTC